MADEPFDLDDTNQMSAFTTTDLASGTDSTQVMPAFRVGSTPQEAAETQRQLAILSYNFGELLNNLNINNFPVAYRTYREIRSLQSFPNSIHVNGEAAAQFVEIAIEYAKVSPDKAFLKEFLEKIAPELPRYVQDGSERELKPIENVLKKMVDEELVEFVPKIVMSILANEKIYLLARSDTTIRVINYWGNKMTDIKDISSKSQKVSKAIGNMIKGFVEPTLDIPSTMLEFHTKFRIIQNLFIGDRNGYKINWFFSSDLPNNIPAHLIAKEEVENQWLNIYQICLFCTERRLMIPPYLTVQHVKRQIQNAPIGIDEYRGFSALNWAEVLPNEF